MTITNDVLYAGVNDRKIDLFEGQYVVPEGMAYNSYVILDEKIAVLDTVDRNFTHEWLDNVAKCLGGRNPDYLIVQHMEPDHSANIVNFLSTYPAATVVSSAKAFAMMGNFFGHDDNLQYNAEKMAQDIETYGLYTYEDFADYVSEEVFMAFPFKYFKVAVGKGEFTFEELLVLIEFYNSSESMS